MNTDNDDTGGITIALWEHLFRRANKIKFNIFTEMDGSYLGKWCDRRLFPIFNKQICLKAKIFALRMV